ncbi:unnamed protein product, partial [Polarella glacialis]
ILTNINASGTPCSDVILLYFERLLYGAMAMAQQPPPAPMRAPGEVGRFDFEPEVEDGLRSATFEMGDLNDGDKVRLTAGTAEARQLMQRDGLTFDEARLQIVRTRMALMGVDSSGMPLDPKTFTFDKVDHGRLPKPLRHSGVDRPGKDFGLTALGSRRVWASLSSPAKAKAAFQNFHLPRFFAERSDDLSGLGLPSEGLFSAEVNSQRLDRSLEILKATTSQIAALGKEKKWQDAAVLFGALQEQRVMPDRQAVGAAITACERGQAWQAALFLLSEAQGRTNNWDAVAYGTTAMACERGRQWAWANWLLGMENMALPSLGKAIKAVDAGSGFGGLDDVTDATHALVAYNATMAGCLSEGRWPRTLHLLERMFSLGVSPDAISYNTAISCSEKGSRWEVALALLTCMELQTSLAPNVISYTAAISACSRGLQWRRALALASEMRLQKVFPNVITYGACIAACARGRQWNRALHLLCQMREQRLQANLVTRNAAVSALAAGRHWLRALEVFGLSDLTASGSRNRRQNIRSDEDQNLRLPRQSSAHGGAGCTEPAVVAHGAALSACEAGGLWIQALALLQRMRLQRLELGPASCNSALGACAKAGRWAQVFHLMSVMKQESDGRAEPDVATFIMAAAACERGGRGDFLRCLHPALCRRSNFLLGSGFGEHDDIDGNGLLGVPSEAMPTDVGFSAAAMELLQRNMFSIGGIVNGDGRSRNLLQGFPSCAPPERAFRRKVLKKVLKQLRLASSVSPGPLGAVEHSEGGGGGGFGAAESGPGLGLFVSELLTELGFSGAAPARHPRAALRRISRAGPAPLPPKRSVPIRFLF